MFLDGLNELDQKILSLLIENARLSYSEIGERVGLSRVAVKARIQGMEESGIIEEYTAVVNPQKISGAVSCYFDIETRPEALEEVSEQLCANEAVTQIDGPAAGRDPAGKPCDFKQDQGCEGTAAVAPGKRRGCSDV